MTRILKFLKKELVLTIAATLALLSMCIVPPNAGYLSYIDFSVLAILFCLMAVVAGFLKSGLFDRLSNSLLARSDSVKVIRAVLVGLCFFSAMLVTNDVALITFVPLTIAVLGGTSPLTLILTIVLETVAANLGSMLTPIGNPQNLYLYSYFNLGITDFLKIVAPTCLISLVLLGIFLLFGKSQRLPKAVRQSPPMDKKQLLLYSGLFLLSIGTVLRLLDYRICFGITLLTLLFLDRKLLLKIDYALLGTFLAFFIFVGNLGNIPAIRELLSQLITGRELLISIAASQIISNVPAAIMLSGFTDQVTPLLLGVNIGGLGTLIASLASLISYKLYMKSENARPLLFFGVFTGINVGMLLILAPIGLLFV